MENKAKISLILGIIASSLIGIGEITFILPMQIPVLQVNILAEILIILSFFSPLILIISIIGLILGKKELKSAKRNLALWGIILCVIGFLGSIHLFIGEGLFVWFLFLHGPF